MDPKRYFYKVVKIILIMNSTNVTPERLQSTIKPLEKLLMQNGFQLEGEPLVDGSVRMASFIKKDLDLSDGEIKVDYTFEIKKDIVKGSYDSETEINLIVDLYANEYQSSLFPSEGTTTNRPLPKAMIKIVRDEIEPNLKRDLQTLL